jgi:hypothetical protein
MKETNMRYALLIYEDEKYYEEATPEDWEKAMVAHNAFGAEAAERGMEPGGDALQPTAAAKTVRFVDGKPTLVTDGPYAETKEQLGGFYILDCQDLDEAIELAAKIPSAEGGAIEIRPIMEMG